MARGLAWILAKLAAAAKINGLSLSLSVSSSALIFCVRININLICLYRSISVDPVSNVPTFVCE